MSDHSFNPILAKKYGVNEAILINNFIFWTRTNAAKQSNFHDDRYWFYGTPEYFARYFVYFTPKQIKYAINNLVEDGFLLKGNYNEKSYDKTGWYSLSDMALNELNLDKTCLQPAKTLIGQNCPIDKTKLSYPSDKIVLPIPDTKPDTKTVVCGRPPTQQEIIEEPKNIELFQQKFSDREITIEELFQSCQNYNAPKKRWVDIQLFYKWLRKEDPENFPRKKTKIDNSARLKAQWQQYYNSSIEKQCRELGHESKTFEQWIAEHKY